MSMKLFILGLPGSGKSTIARHVIDYVGRQKSDCHTVRVNDYGILYAMYKADTEGKFSPTGHGKQLIIMFRLFSNLCSFLLSLLAMIITMPCNSSLLIFYWALIFFFLTLTSRHAKLAFKSASLIHKHWMITKFQSISSIHIMLKRA